MQERIGELCHRFKLPTMGARSVSHFTAPDHDDALATFLDVPEEEAEDRRQRRISSLRKESMLPSGKIWEHLRPAMGTAGASEAAGPGQLRGAGRQRAGLRTSRHRQECMTWETGAEC